jgi:CRP/FNR family transcriptional regulator, anaerobic regulatory protein
MSSAEHFTAYVHQFVQPSAVEMAHFLSLMEVIHVKKNDVLVRAGEICDKAWFVHQGLLRHYLIKGEEEGTVWFSFSGDIATEIYSLVTQKAAVHNIIAVADSTLLVISNTHLQYLYDTEKVWERFGRLTSVQYLLLQMERVNDLLFKTGKEKYDAFISAHPEALEHIPLHQIAQFIGVKFETLSRIRGRRN